MKKLTFAILFILVFAGNVFATFQQRTVYSNDAAYRTQVMYAMQAASVAILGEAATTAHHEKRCEFAQLVQKNGYSINSIALLVTTNSVVGPVIDGGGIPSDQQIYDAIAGLWNQLAGVITE